MATLFFSRLFQLLLPAAAHVHHDGCGHGGGDDAAVPWRVAVVVAVCLTALIGLPLIAFAAQFWAKRRTFPCPHCMEFIPKSSAQCPRCGKTPRPAEPFKAKGS